MRGTNQFDYQLGAGVAAAFVVVLAGCAGPAPQSVPAADASQPGASSSSTRPAVPAAGAPVWHYEGAEGPANWGKLSPAFASCGEGQHQSPIDISKPARGTTAELKTAFPPAALRIAHHEHIADGINNGHTIQINYPAADTLTLGPASYQLVQYHFHSPSEHTVDGKHFPMEMHMVHKSAGGQARSRGGIDCGGSPQCGFRSGVGEPSGAEGCRDAFPFGQCRRRRPAANGSDLVSLRRLADHAALLGRRALDHHDHADPALERTGRRIYTPHQRQQPPCSAP